MMVLTRVKEKVGHRKGFSSYRHSSKAKYHVVGIFLDLFYCNGIENSKLLYVALLQRQNEERI